MSATMPPPVPPHGADSLDRSPSTGPSDGDVSLPHSAGRLARGPSTSLRKAQTYSELQASAPNANGARLLPKPTRNANKQDPNKDPPKPPLAKAATTASFTHSASPLDPLSQHILLKTSSDPSKSRGRNSSALESPAGECADLADADPGTRQSSNVPDAPKKGPSLLSRLTMRTGKKKTDDDSEASSQPVADGYVYIPHHKEPPGYIKFKRHHKKTNDFTHVFLCQRLAGTLPPPSRTTPRGPDIPADDDGAGEASTTHHNHSHGKDQRTGGAVWAMAFSNDGKYLATAGRDKIVRVFAVISTHEERKLHEEETYPPSATPSDARPASGDCLSAPVFRAKPVREFTGHTGEILDLAWSKNNFLLSTAMDRTVRLWHMSRSECLCAFQHKEPVSSVAFHPRDDRFFLAGSVDSTIRLWSIPDKAVAYSAQVPEVVTAVAFSPGGVTCMAGTLHGLLLFYDTDGLRYRTQIHVRSSRGRNAKGSKITGIDTMCMSDPSSTATEARNGNGASEDDGDVKVLVTSTDSRIRIYNLKDKTLAAKFKGHENTVSQMRASFSDDGRWVICGSEDGKAYTWPVGGAESEPSSTGIVVAGVGVGVGGGSGDSGKKGCEWFEASGGMLTGAVFAPVGARTALDGGGDPIYDLCNPPPVKLLSREEASASQTALSEVDGAASASASAAAQQENTPAYIARSTHRAGQIIVTSDRAGVVKVFRQDCAFQKRRNENWEAGSALSKRFTGGLGRSGSVVTRNSGGSLNARSRRGSMTIPSVGGAGSSDRILSWRQGIEHGRTGSAGTGSVAGTVAGSSVSGSVGDRSRSPSRVRPKAAPINTAVANLASEARRQGYSPALRSGGGFSSPLVSAGPTSPSSQRTPSRDGVPPTPSFTFKAIDEDVEEVSPSGDAKAEVGGLSAPSGARNTSRWSIGARWKGIVRHASQHNPHNPTAKGLGGRGGTAASTTDSHPSVGMSADDLRNSEPGDSPRRAGRLLRRESDADTVLRRSTSRDSGHDDGFSSDSRSPGDEEYMTDEGGQAETQSQSPHHHHQQQQAEGGEEGEDDEGEACLGCGNREFKAKKVGGKQRFVCGRCGALVSTLGG